MSRRSNQRQTTLDAITPLPGKPPRAKPQWRMRIDDAGEPPTKPPPGMTQYIRYVCPRCGHDAGWHFMPSVTAAKRGLPCPVCNKAEGQQ